MVSVMWESKSALFTITYPDGTLAKNSLKALTLAMSAVSVTVFPSVCRLVKFKMTREFVSLLFSHYNFFGTTKRL